MGGVKELVRVGAWWQDGAVMQEQHLVSCDVLQGPEAHDVGVDLTQNRRKMAERK